MGLVFWDSGRTYGGKNTLRAIVNCTWRTRGTSVAILGGTLVRCAPSLPYVVRFFYKKITVHLLAIRLCHAKVLRKSPIV